MTTRSPLLLLAMCASACGPLTVRYGDNERGSLGLNDTDTDAIGVDTDDSDDSDVVVVDSDTDVGTADTDTDIGVGNAETDTDLGGDSGATSIPNHPPEMNACIVTSATDGLDAARTAEATATDPDGDPIVATYTWETYFNPLWIRVPDLTSAVMPPCTSGNAAASDPKSLYNCYGGTTRRAKCTVTDPDGATAYLWSAPFRLGYTFVTLGVSLGPASPTELAPPRAVVSVESLDPAAITLSYTWRVAGAVVADVDDTLDASLYAKGDAIQVEVTATAGAGTISTSQTASTVIANTPPTVSACQVSPGTGDTTTVWTASATGVSDADGDSTTTSVVWEQLLAGTVWTALPGETAGTLAACADRTVSGGFDCAPGTTLRARCTVSDGNGSSDTASAPVTLAP